MSSPCRCASRCKRPAPSASPWSGSSPEVNATGGEGDRLVEELLLSAVGEAERLRAEGRWNDAAEAELEARFEEAVVGALSARTASERAIRVGRLARRVVPPRLRPALRRLVRRAEGLLARRAGSFPPAGQRSKDAPR